MEEEKKQKRNNTNIVMSLLCYLGALIIIPLVTDAKKDPYVKFHIRQGLLLLITGIGVWIVSIILGVPVLSWILVSLLWLGLLALVITGVINSVSGKKNVLPVIGKYTDKIKI